MNKCTPGEMDFDAWLEVARRDPQAFEALRLAAIEEAIEKAPQANRARLRRLQWRIDQERRLAHSPIDACIRTSRLMWRGVIGPGGLQERLNELQARLGGTPGPRPTSANVVAFIRD